MPHLYVGGNRALLTTTFGALMYVDTRDILIAPRLLMFGEWEPTETALVKEFVKPGMTFLDVGANLGYFSLLAAKLGANVVSFEPNPHTYELLAKNVLVNWMSGVVRTENFAVYDRSTTLNFHARTAFPGNSSLEEMPQSHLSKHFDTSTQYSVKAVALDDYFTKGTRIDFLKIDVEGFELPAFQGMRRLLLENQSIQILCEWSISQMGERSPAALLNEFSSLGLKTYWIDDGLKPAGDLLNTPHCNLLLRR